MDILTEYTAGGLYIRHAADEAPSGRNCRLHVHDRCEIFYFISGEAEYIVEGSAYPLSAGSTLIMRAGEAHCIRILRPERCERFAVNFPLSLFDTIDPERSLTAIFTGRELGQDNMYIIHGLRPVFEDMCRAGLDPYSRELRMKVGILKILDALSQCTSAALHSRPAEPALGEQILSYVNSHLFEELTIDSLAEQFFLSRSQLARVFKKATGAPPRDYITAKRLVAAKGMIAAGATAKKAALDCGFGDYSCFYKAYMKKFGQSPKGQRNTSGGG